MSNITAPDRSAVLELYGILEITGALIECLKIVDKGEGLAKAERRVPEGQRERVIPSDLMRKALSSSPRDAQMNQRAVAAILWGRVGVCYQNPSQHPEVQWAVVASSGQHRSRRT